MAPTPRMISSAKQTLCLAIAFASLAAPPSAQEAEQRASAAPGPRLYAGIASADHRREVPAIAWLCEEYLPTLPQWPAGLDPRGSFSLSLSSAGLQIRPTEVAMPSGAVAIGACTSGSQEQELVWRCSTNGRERWFVPADFEVLGSWRQLLHAIEGDLIGTPRTLALPVIIGHLAGVLVDDDPATALLRLCPAQCGDVTWMASERGEQLEICGRSGGGLMLPLAIFLLAIEGGSGEPSALSLRAFAARDADQAEAARQLGRSDLALDVATLRSLLHADDPVRLTAIESLVRHGQDAELINIIASADADKPWATIAAHDAVLRLWPSTSSDSRRVVLAALAQSESPALRELATSGLLTASTASNLEPLTEDTSTLPESISDRARMLIALFLVSVGLFGLWARERATWRTRTS